MTIIDAACQGQHRSAMLAKAQDYDAQPQESGPFERGFRAFAGAVV